MDQGHQKRVPKLTLDPSQKHQLLTLQKYLTAIFLAVTSAQFRYLLPIKLSTLSTTDPVCLCQNIFYLLSKSRKKVNKDKWNRNEVKYVPSSSLASMQVRPESASIKTNQKLKYVFIFHHFADIFAISKYKQEARLKNTETKIQYETRIHVDTSWPGNLAGVER